MKKWILHILLFASLFGMLTTSCSQDEEIADFPSAGTPSEKVTIRFTLDLGEQGGIRSRSSWEGYDEDDTNDSNQAEPGIGDENYIDTNSLQVFMFKTDGTYIGGLKDMEAKRQGDSNIYNIKGEVDVDKSAIVNEVLNCKIMVVANANAATVNNGQVTGYNNDAIFNHNVTSIPMWGIGTYTINLIQQLQVDLAEPIYMLRSKAKIEVTLNQAVYDEGYRITSATLNKYNTQGYVVPTLPLTTGDSPVVDWNNLTNTTTLSTANVFRENESLAGTASSPTPKSFSANVAGKSYVIYVPEYANTNGDLEIQLTITDDSGNELQKEGGYKIIHGNYSEGKPVEDNTPTPVVRNHYYQYNINKVENGVDAEITLTVTPWSVNQSTVDYRNEVSVTQEISWNNDVYPTSNRGIVLSDDLNEVSFSFNLATPRGGKWHAELVKVSGTDGAFMFKNATGELSQSIEGTIDGNPRTLTIVATQADGDVTENNEYLLKIYVEAPALEGTTPRQADVTNLLGAYTIVQSKLMNN